jgi:hypothetical protein
MKSHSVLMKYILSIFILALVFNTSISAQEREEVLKILDNPKPYLEAIQSDIKSRDLSWEGDKKLANRIQGLAYAINQEILAAESKDWAKPSSKRIAIIEKWGAVLEPYTKDLLIVAMEENKTRERSSTQARSILDFAKPTEQFGNEVRNYLNGSRPETASLASYLLYEHRLLTKSDLDILRTIIDTTNKPESKSNALMSLSFYGATDGLENAREILRRKPASNEAQKIVTQYSNALDFITMLGPEVHSLLVDLDALIFEIDKLQIGESKFGLMTKFQYARDLITGKESMQVRLAKNGSGPLALKIGDLPRPETQDDQSRKDTSLERPEKSRSSADSKSSNDIKKESTTFPWMIIASFIGLLVLAACLARKSKH